MCMAPERVTATPCPRRAHNILTACVLFALAFAAATAAFAQQPPTSALSPEAQESVNKGILAANGQDYPLALRYFQNARKIAGDAPEVLFNLGLAESKIPGQELRAICWFGAYLAAAPGATNVAAVKQEIDALDVKSQGTISRLVNSAQTAASKLPPGDARNQALSRVVVLWLISGDSAQALTVAGNLDSTWKQKTADSLRQLPSPETLSATTFSVADWANKPGDDPVFLDLAGYLKSQSSNDPQQLFDSLYGAAEKLASTQYMIERQLEPQTERIATAKRDQSEVSRVGNEIERIAREAQQAHDNEPNWARCTNQKDEPDIAGENERIAACTAVIGSGRTGKDLALAYFYRGAAFGRIGKHDEGVQDDTESIKIDPSNMWAYFNRGFLYARYMGQYARGIQDYQQALRLNTDPVNVKFIQGWIHLAQDPKSDPTQPLWQRPKN